MIEITRRLARRLVNVFRDSVWRGPRWQVSPPVVLLPRDAGLTVQCQSEDVAIAYHSDQGGGTSPLVLDREALECVAAGRDTSVRFLDPTLGRVRATWDQGGHQRWREFESIDPNTEPTFPPLPDVLADPGPGFIAAMAEASAVASEFDLPRYPLSAVLVRGRGDVAASDGKHLLVTRGFMFPWNEGLLVRDPGVFAAAEFRDQLPTSVGRTATHLAVRTGPWEVHLRLNLESRYPDVDAVLTSPSAAVSRCHFSAQDAADLLARLPILPGNGRVLRPVILELHGSVAVSGIDEDGYTEQVLLPGSSHTGPHVRVTMNRNYLRRALGLGFTDLTVTSSHGPLRCDDGHRTYFWMPLTG